MVSRKSKIKHLQGRMMLLMAFLLFVMPGIGSAYGMPSAAGQPEMLKLGEQSPQMREITNGTGSIEGTVYDGNGQPIKGATVILNKGITTDESGTYRFENLGAGKYRVEASTNINSVRIEQEYAEIFVKDGQKVQVNFTLSSTYNSTTGAVSGKAADGNGQPLANARVSLSDEDYTLYWSTSTDQNGNYSIGGIPVGSYRVHSSYRDKSTDTSISQTIENIEVKENQSASVHLSLGRTATPTAGAIQGKFLDENGNAISGGSVTVKNNENHTRWNTSVDKQGNYSVGALKPGTYRLEAYYNTDKFSVSKMKKDILVKANETVDINLNFVCNPTTNTGTVTGKVIDVTTKKPVDDSWVWIESKDDSIRYHPKIDDQGKFSVNIIEPGKYEMGAGADRTEEVYVYAHGKELEIKAGSHADVDFELSMTPSADNGIVAGKVTNAATGQPIKRAWMSVLDANKNQLSIRKDADGHYRIDGLSRGTYRVSASKDGYVYQSKDKVEIKAGEQSTVDFKLSKKDGKQEEKKLKSLTVNKTKLSLKPDGEEQLILTAAYTDGKTENVTDHASWTTSNDKVATVEAGLVKALQFGKANITASYEDKKVTIAVEVKTKALKSLSASKSKLNLKPGLEEQIQLLAKFDDRSEANVTDQAEWTSKDDKIATVEKGLVEAVGYGQTFILAKYGNKTVTITVDSSIKNLTADKKKMTLGPEQEQQISLIATLPDGNKEDVTEQAEWSTKNSNIAKVENGRITAAGLGKTTITAKFGGKAVTMDVEVKIQKLLASNTKVTLQPDAAEQITLTAILPDGSELNVTDQAEWSTKKSTIAEVDTGLITARGIGKTTVSAKYAGKTVTISVSVKK